MMSLFVFALVAVSASFHVLWNTLVKTCHDKLSFALLTSLVSMLFLLPAGLFIEGRAWFNQPAGFWTLAALSGFFEALYTILLFQAYRHNDLSVVYPLSRGIAPVVTMAASGSLIGDAVSPLHAHLVGVILIGILCIVISIRRSDASGINLTGIVFAMATGVAIAGYHLVDRKVMMAVLPPSPLAYLVAMHVFLVLYISIYVLVFSRHRLPVGEEWRTNHRGVLTVGICAPLAYLLIMVALQYGNVTHVAAARNIGIMFSTLVGGLVLKEGITFQRAAGALMIAGGVAGLVIL